MPVNADTWKLSHVQGHLESYADKIEKFGVPGPSQPTQMQLARALREDAQALQDLVSTQPLSIYSGDSE